MKKLQNKTYILLISILSLFLLTILFIFNISLYKNEYNELNRKLLRVLNVRDKFMPGDNRFRNPMFMDMDVYVVSFDENDNITNINNYTNEDVSEEFIKKIILKNKNKIGRIGNLYLNKYVLFNNDNGELIIINNSYVRSFLVTNLYKTFFIFILLEVVIIYVSYLLTKWLVKQVNDSFIKQKQFIYDASHELKTPLAIIMASADELDNNDKFVSNIKSEAERMNKLVINLLELSKSEDVIGRETFGEVNLSKLVMNKSLSFESLMFDSNVSLKLNIEDNIMFNCNGDRIKELLSILIDNAIKHAYSKSKVTVSLSREKEKIILSVKNRGEAIPVDEREKIFERFYRGDKSRNRDSDRYGLGLAIASNIVSAHNGEISVDCRNGYTTFTVIFKKN